MAEEEVMCEKKEELLVVDEVVVKDAEENEVVTGE
jgi:hypothetical protein